MIAAFSRRLLADRARANSVEQALNGRPFEDVTAAVSDDFLCFAPESEAGSAAPHCLVFGRIDNSADMRVRLGLGPSADLGQIYAAAVERWRDEADLHLVGHYCSIVIEGPSRLRLARSPWTAPPLHFSQDGSTMGASPLVAALFAAGFERRVDYEYLADQLAFDHHHCETRGWFEGIGRVPIGSIVRLDPSGIRLAQYYDPLDVPQVSLPRDEDYVDRARELLDEAAAKALGGIARPAMMLSGGLDSPIAAESVSRQLGQGRTLAAVTFGPVDEWDGIVPGHLMGDERELVRAFAARHPGIESHMADPAMGGHDFRLRDLLARTQVPTANVANIGIFHGPFQTAVDLGCDAVLTALHGNFTFSLEGMWAYPEYARRMRWIRLLRLLRGRRVKDDRSLLRMAAAMGVLPNLPDAWQRAVRSLARRGPDVLHASLLTREAETAWRRRADARRSESAFEQMPLERTREQAITRMWWSADSGEDLDLGLARQYGVQYRDVTAYRPLIEFCHGLPTDQFVSGGTDRWLARRMARGIMPENQRLNPKMGRHNVDWHARLSPRRDELSDYAERMRAHAKLSEIIDIDRLQELLENWPETTPLEPEKSHPYYFGLTRALTAAHFVSASEGRNDF